MENNTFLSMKFSRECENVIKSLITVHSAHCIVRKIEWNLTPIGEGCDGGEIGFNGKETIEIKTSTELKSYSKQQGEHHEVECYYAVGFFFFLGVEQRKRERDRETDYMGVAV